VGPISLDEALMLRCGRQQAAAARQGVPVVTAAADKVPDEPVAGPAGQTDPCAPSDTPGIHTVRKGETIYAISRQYGVSVADIKTWNQLSGTMIGVCSKLFVRDPATVQTGMTRSVPAAETDPLPARVEYWLDAPAVHTVRPGETVAGLARLFGYTEDRFRRMNALRPDGRLVPGQQVRTTDCICPGDPLVQAASLSEGLSGGSDPGTAADPTDVYFKPVGIHRVSPTETLFGIARQYGTTVERLRELNGMDADDDIRPGQRIYIQ
jgi:membrane-bound lytic murein transglycosylase D